MLCQPRSLPLGPLAEEAFLPGVSAQEQERGFAAGGRQCCRSPTLRKAEILSGCRGENRFFAVLSILHPNRGQSWGLPPPPPRCTQPCHTFSRGFGASQRFPFPHIKHVTAAKYIEATEQEDFPCLGLHGGTAGVFYSTLFGNTSLAGKCGMGRAAVGVALGCCQEGCNTVEQPRFPAHTLSCSYLQLTSVWISLSPSAASAEPQPGLFLADLFIWVLHCLRPRLSFCCTCASVRNPGSFWHMGGVSFYPKSPSGTDNCLTEDQGEDGVTGGVPAWGWWGGGGYPGSRKKRLDREYMNNKLRCFKFLFL